MRAAPRPLGGRSVITYMDEFATFNPNAGRRSIVKAAWHLIRRCLGGAKPTPPPNVAQAAECHHCGKTDFVANLEEHTDVLAANMTYWLHRNPLKRHYYHPDCWHEYAHMVACPGCGTDVMQSVVDRYQVKLRHKEGNS